MIRAVLRHFFCILGYPKLLLLAATYALAILLLDAQIIFNFMQPLHALGYFGDFLAGFFYAYEISAAPAAIVLLFLAKGQNIFLAAIAGGFGALASDLVIFFFIRNTMLDEIKKISGTKIAMFIEKEEGLVFGRFKKYILYVLAAFFVASPLPTEIGISIFAAIKGMTPKRFIVLAYLLHTAGILTILWMGSII